jgi:hypothetical protein
LSSARDQADLRPIVQLNDAFVFVLAPLRSGIGTGGLKGYVQDRAGRTFLRWKTRHDAGRLVSRENSRGVHAVQHAPQIRRRRRMKPSSSACRSRAFRDPSVYLGSTFVNDFNVLDAPTASWREADDPARRCATS